VVDRDRVRVPGEPRHGQGLTGEPLAHGLVLCIPPVEQLDRNRAAERRVRRADDLAHAAAADRLGAGVAVGQEVGCEGHRLRFPGEDETNLRRRKVLLAWKSGSRESRSRDPGLPEMLRPSLLLLVLLAAAFAAG